MIYAIAGLNILGMLSILIEKTERSDTTNLQYSIVNIQFRLVRVGILKQGNLAGKIDVCLVMPDAPLFGRSDCEKTFCH